MASWLVIDWDQDQFHLLCADTSRRGVLATHAVTWTHPEPFTPSTAERVGKALREFLKSAKITPAPVIVGLGRDRIFLKELRFPAIAAHEEANLVRFQTGKEMAESVENYAIDYTPLSSAGADRQVAAVAARRDIVAMLRTLCDAAGLKLHAVTPKLFGLPYVLERAMQPEASPLRPNHLNIVLNFGQRWAELCFFRGDRLLQAQALSNGPLLASEVKRSLAVFQAQTAVNMELDGPDCLYVFGDDPAAVQNLQSGQGLTVRVLDPLKDDADIAKDPAHFAGAVGLAALWSRPADKPVNLATPKRGQAPGSSRQFNLVAAVAVFFVALIAVGSMWFILSSRRATIRTLGVEKMNFEEELRKNSQERAELDAYKEWEQTTVPWLDEMYDLTARYPDAIGFRVTQLSATTNPAGKKGKGGYVGNIKFTGVAPAGKESLVFALQKNLADDKHIRAENKYVKPGTGARTNIDYQMTIDIAKQDANKYDTILELPKRR